MTWRGKRGSRAPAVIPSRIGSRAPGFPVLLHGRGSSGAKLQPSHPRESGAELQDPHLLRVRGGDVRFSLIEFWLIFRLVKILGPKQYFGGPKRCFGSPKLCFGGAKRCFGGLKRYFGGPKLCFGGSRKLWLFLALPQKPAVCLTEATVPK